jgi:hypothetical protein
MKKVILIIVVFMASLAVNAQNPSKNKKKEYSFAWGLFKSKNYPKDKIAVFKLEKPKTSTSFVDMSLDTTKYEQKSILWGAIQWSEKKKISSK